MRRCPSGVDRYAVTISRKHPDVPIGSLMLFALEPAGRPTFLHLGGDACLRSIARVVAGVADGTKGIAARIGGEEFAVILPDTTQLRAQEIAEEIRLSVEHLALAHSSSPYGVQTVSIGVAVLVPLDGQVPIDLMKLADQALYSAKLSGRNQVACT